jgi:hypothetical protein
LGIRLAVALAATVLLATFALDAQAGKRKKVGAKIEISYQTGATHRIVGDINSRKKECFRHRVVYLSVDGAVRNQTVSGRRGGFELPPSSEPPQSGVSYTAELRRKVVLNRGNPRPKVVCKPKASNTVVSP